MKCDNTNHTQTYSERVEKVFQWVIFVYYLDNEENYKQYFRISLISLYPFILSHNVSYTSYVSTIHHWISTPSIYIIQTLFKHPLLIIYPFITVLSLRESVVECVDVNRRCWWIVWMMYGIEQWWKQDMLNEGLSEMTYNSYSNHNDWI